MQCTFSAKNNFLPEQSDSENGSAKDEDHLRKYL